MRSALTAIPSILPSLSILTPVLSAAAFRLDAGEAAVAPAAQAAVAPAAQGVEGALDPVPFTKVRIQDKFWAPRIETHRTVTLPHNIMDGK